MKKGLIIGVVVGAVLVVGGVSAYFLTKDNDSSNQQATQQTQSQENQQSTGTSNTNIRALLAKGENQKCTFSNADGSGTMYFTSGKMAADFTVTSNGETRNGKMIIMNDQQYFWETSSNRGVKLAFTSSTSEQSSEQNTESSSGLDTNTNFDFNCTSWQVDNSLFTPPTNVEFIDLQNLESPIGQ